MPVWRNLKVTLVIVAQSENVTRMDPGSPMSRASGREYLRRIYPRYQRASRPEKEHIADGFCQMRFLSDFEIGRNKGFRNRYQLMGRTWIGRQLKLIFQMKP